MNTPKGSNAVGVVALLILIGVLWSVNFVSGAENEPLKGPARFVLENYERIQKALAADSMTDIPESASTIAKVICTDAGNTLPLTVAEEAEKLADAKDLKAARSAMNYPAASRGVSSSVLARHSVLDTESSWAFWIPAGVYPGENRGRYDELAASRGE